MSAEQREGHRQRVADFVTREWSRLVGAVRSWIDDEADRMTGQRALRERIDAAIGGLGDAERAVFLATELEGRKFRELAAEWDTPIGTLLARKHRAVKRLRAALADIDRDTDEGGP